MRRRPLSPYSHHRRPSLLWVAALCWLLVACAQTPTSTPTPHGSAPTPLRVAQATPAAPTTIASAPTPTPDLTARILAREHVPILCYHHVHDWTLVDRPTERPYIVPVARFEAQMAFLEQSGYHTIAPQQLVAFLTSGTPLPDKPILLTFDDGDGDVWTNAVPLLEKYHFTATFFIMTVVLDKPFYLSRQQVQQLDGMGMTIGAHTWDHHRVTNYTDSDWERQLTAPTRELAQLVGHPIRYFAYPYGLWNTAAITHLQQAGFEAAFQLEAPPDSTAPLFTIPRVIGSGLWTASNLAHALQTRF